MKFELAPLPYETHALEPHISARTLEIHYGKHHQGYLNKLQAQLEPEGQSDRALLDIIRNSSGDLFNNAAQVWNHSFYWRSMAPSGGGQPTGELNQRIASRFGSVEACKRELAEAATGEFGSGWAWLIQSARDRKLQVVHSSDAENPLQRGNLPLLAIDVWEHAYYLDRQNDRGAYVDAFLEHLVDWTFAARNLERGAPLDDPLSEALAGEGNRAADRHYRQAATRFAGTDRQREAARAAADSAR